MAQQHPILLMIFGPVHSLSEFETTVFSLKIVTKIVVGSNFPICITWKCLHPSGTFMCFFLENTENMMKTSVNICEPLRSFNIILRTF